MSLRRRYLDKVEHLHLRPAVTAFVILSALMLSTCGAKGSVMTAKQTHRCATACVKDQAIDAVQAELLCKLTNASCQQK